MLFRSGSRAVSENENGEETGKDYDSKINSIQVLLYDEAGTFIAASNQPKLTGGNSGLYNLSFAMDALYKRAEADRAINLKGYIVCNDALTFSETPNLDEVKQLVREQSP